MAFDVPPMTLDDAQHIYERPAYVDSVSMEDTTASAADALKAQKKEHENEAAKARSQALLNTALGVGVKAGMAWQLRNIEAVIQRREREFDTVYDFSHLMIRDRVVPPVVTEARDLYNQDGDYVFRLSGAYYTIENQARFSSVAPNWREYLTFPKPNVDRSTLFGMFPRDPDEEYIWKLAVADGWEQGVDQANIMLKHGLDRMNRDLVGMIRFHTFVLEGKITMPAIANESIAVSKSGRTMAVDETLFRITTLPEFNEKIQVWNASVKTSALDSSENHGEAP